MNNHLDELFRSRPATVAEVVEEAPSVKTLKLKITGDYAAEPGQFNMLYYWGVGEAPVSLANIPRRADGWTFIEHTVKAVGSVTSAIVGNAKEGFVLGLRGPYGRGWPLRGNEGLNILVVAGGIGIATLRPVIAYVSTNREAYGDVYVLYGARSPDHLIYRGEFESWRRSRVKLMLSVDAAPTGWLHYVGPVTDLIDYVDLDASETVAYICGPEAMMRVAVKKLLERGFRKDRVFLSIERRMRCGIGVCGTCQIGHLFACRDGPVFSYGEVEDYIWVEGI